MAAFLSIIDWDLNYSYAFVSFVIGALAGFQAIYERHGEESATSVATLPGLGYLFSLAEYLAEVQKAGTSDPSIEERYKLKLGYWIYRNTHGWHGLKVLYKF
jgi:hypothetical protein